jgi:osmotically-inducible protein OsmY
MRKTDSQLQLDVLNELKWEPGVDHEKIGVSADDGVITLSGLVPSFSQKLLAEKVARRVKGVRAVAEEIEVRFAFEPKTSDTEIAKRVADVLEWNSFLPRGRINVTVEDRVVKLKGDVDWGYQKNMAFKEASKISGIIRVDNLIKVSPTVDKEVIRDKIEDAFERQADLQAEKIQVKTEGHRVILSGKVNSWNQRSIAERAAWAAPGVTQVEDNLVVGYSS